MKTLVRAVFMLILSGCVSSLPESTMRPTTRPVAATLDCIISGLNVRGFTLVNSDRSVGVIAGEKKTRRGPRLITGVNTFDRITASVFTDPATSRAMLRLLATTIFEDVPVGGGVGKRDETEPSDDLREQAASLLEECGK